LRKNKKQLGFRQAVFALMGQALKLLLHFINIFF